MRRSYVALGLGVRYIVAALQVAVLLLGHAVVRPLEQQIGALYSNLSVPLRCTKKKKKKEAYQVAVVDQTASVVLGSVVVDIMSYAVRLDALDPQRGAVVREIKVGTAANAKDAAEIRARTGHATALVGRAHRLHQAGTHCALETGPVVVVQRGGGQATLRVRHEAKRVE